MTISAKSGIIITMNHAIYLDHAATTPLDQDVLEKMLPYFTEHFGNADSPHARGRKALAAVDEARDKIAALLGAKSNEVYFTSGGTEADNWAVLGGAYARRAEKRTHVVVSAIEHHAVLSAAQRLEKEGFSVTYLPVDKGGRVSLSDVAAAVSDKTALVAVMAANNETGVIQPVKEIGEIAKARGALFFSDAVQAAPYMPIDVNALGADMLAFSGHKFYGPKGIGALYIRGGVRVEKLVGGGEQERGLRGETVNVPSVVGFAAAYEKATADMAKNNAKLQTLSARFMREISSLAGVERNGNAENALPSVCNLRFKGVENTAFLYNMDLRGIALAAGSACASASVKPSHVLTAMGLTEREAKESVRFSFGKNNTEEEIVQSAKATAEVIERLRGETFGK